MIKAHKIRLHPTPEQANYFAQAAGTARFTFNWALAEWKRQFEAGEKPSALALKKQFNAIRKEQFSWSYEVTKCAIEGAFMDVAAAFKNFFEARKTGRKVGYPQFKSKKRSRQSFYLANDKFRIGDHWIDVPKLGRVNMAETVRFCGKILSARISKTADWWFVSITVEMPDEIPVNTNPPVGIDVGLNRLATLSDGRRYRCLSLSFSDAALGKLLDLLATKVTHAGGYLVQVDRFFPSSKRCHLCHEKRTDLTLANRMFVCQNPVCGYVGDRDENASLNILQEALRLVGQS